MNQEIKDLWLKELRSGRYKQGRKALKTEDGYCCLGVLCDIYAQETDTKWAERNFLGKISYSIDTAQSYLSIDVRDWAGLESSDPKVKVVNVLSSYLRSESLSKINDDGATFAEIADAIEKSL